MKRPPTTARSWHGPTSVRRPSRLHRSQRDGVTAVADRQTLRLAAGKQLRIGRDVLTPVGVKGWYHAVFRDAKGGERLLSIDQVLENM